MSTRHPMVATISEHPPAGKPKELEQKPEAGSGGHKGPADPWTLEAIMTTQEELKSLIPNPQKSLRAGCYAIQFQPDRGYEEDAIRYEKEKISYRGTLRVEHLNAEGETLAIADGRSGTFGEFFRASGDMYAVSP